MPKGDRGLQSIRSTVSVARYSQGAASVTERGIRKSLSPERFVVLREGEAKPGDPTATSRTTRRCGGRRWPERAT